MANEDKPKELSQVTAEPNLPSMMSAELPTGEQVENLDEKLKIPVQDPAKKDFVVATIEEIQNVEREIQLGNRDTTIDGKNINDIYNETVKLQDEQFAARRTLAEEGMEVAKPEEEKVRVMTTLNGGTITMPVETAQPEPPPTNAADSDIPNDFPGRAKLIEQGGEFIRYEFISKLNESDFEAIPGFGAASAKKAAAYLNKSSGDTQ